MTTILYTLYRTNILPALSMITTMSGYQLTVSQLKQELEREKKSNSELTEERTLQKEVDDLKVQLDEEKKQIDVWAPQVYLPCTKLEHLLPIYTTHVETCTSFASP